MFVAENGKANVLHVVVSARSRCKLTKTYPIAESSTRARTRRRLDILAYAGRSKDVELDLGPEVDSVARPAECSPVALPELGAKLDKVKDGGEPPDALPQR
jgi:hypothetical protein